MDKLDRFRRLVGQRQDPGPGVDTPALASPSSSSLPDYLDTPHGKVRVLDKRLETAIPYAPTLMSRVLLPEVTAGAAWLKDERLRGFGRDGALFLDVETTGLSHGAGTVAFLLGLAWFEGEELVLRQVLLEDYDQEQAQLHLLLERLAQSRFLVTYNGKSFDRSVLESRLVIHRFMDLDQAHMKLMPHLDLLHLGRRLYSGMLDSHTLSRMEAEVLGFLRTDDIAGALVPQMYFQYLLTRDESVLEPVLRHNFDDVLSLVHLADALLRLVRPEPPSDNPDLAANLGKLFCQAGFHAEAVPNLHVAVAQGTEVQAVRSARLLGAALRRGGRLEPESWRSGQDGRKAHSSADSAATIGQAALQAWLTVAQRFPDSVDALVELAKILGRRGGDPAGALALIDRALALRPGDPDLLRRRERVAKVGGKKREEDKQDA